MYDIDIVVCFLFYCLKYTYYFFFLQNDFYFIKKLNGKNNDEKEFFMNKISELNFFIDRFEKELSKVKVVKEV